MPAAKQSVSFVTFPLAQIIARDLGVREAQVESTITLIEEGATMPLQANQNIVTLADISPTGLGVALNKGTSLARNE